MNTAKTGALIVDFVAHIYDVSHINQGEFFDDEALQYMIERTGLDQDTASDVFWLFADNHDAMVSHLTDRRIKLA